MAKNKHGCGLIQPECRKRADQYADQVRNHGLLSRCHTMISEFNNGDWTTENAGDLLKEIEGVIGE